MAKKRRKAAPSAKGATSREVQSDSEANSVDRDSPPPPIHVEEPTRERYAEAIISVCRKGALTIGMLLIDAKAKLKHGDFEGMIEDDLPFGPRTAERLMLVARNEVLSNPTRASLLPGAWTVLHELALV